MKPALIFLILVISLLTTTIGAGAAAVSVSQDLVDTVIKPLTKLVKELTLPSTPPPPIPSLSVASAAATPTVSPKPTVKPTKRAVVVTPKPYPTPKPGDPGSPEWQTEFDRKWKEMGEKNAAMQKQVEDSQKQFCLDNPNLCK